MPRKTKKPSARDYRHDDQKALLRPEGGTQDVFPQAKRKARKVYRYDSSLAPELVWDEGEVRGEAEGLIARIIDSKNLDAARRAAEELKNLSKPFLNWAGKAERGRIEVPTLPLFVHERQSTQAMLETLKRHHRTRGQTLDLFGEGDLSLGEKIRGAYEHLNGWQNRLILGDSLQVMNSLVEYESLGRQVQMVYMDPPYGIKFGGNFQPFVRKRDSKEGDDDSISREPEMVQAYRDTWELGIHSWLTYMRDRLLLVRELLTDSGSCFVQISDENVHLVRCVMDEVFGRENFVNQISFRTAMTKPTDLLNNVYDCILWYAKDKSALRFRSLFVKRDFDDSNEIVGTQQLEASVPQTKYSFEYQGKTYNPKNGWRVSSKGMQKLADADRLHAAGSLRFIRYAKDFECVQMDNMWSSQMSEQSKTYVVQTSIKVIQRCILMTTDPGDLIFDPTCGSGTTAYVAEQWGRRWITTDVSRVPLALARQRLLTATYPYYQLKDQQRGPSGGFVYARKRNKKGEEVGGIVPHITLKSIANDEPAAEEVLVDKPEVASNTTRISGPFCVEAVLPTPLSPESEIREPTPAESLGDEEDHILRMIRILKLSPVLHLPENEKFNLDKVRAPAKSLNLHAEGVHVDDKDADGEAAIAIVFGPANGAISERAVIEAGKEARHKNYARLLVIAFAIEPAARQTIEKGEATFGLPAIYAQASTDLVMSDLLKNMRSSQIFSVVGLPDVELEKASEKAEDGGDLWQATLHGLDVFDPATMQTTSLNGDDVPCWMLDTDYDGQCFRAGQVFFPRTAAWDKIRKAVKADFDETVWEHLRGATSAPFAAGQQVAVKVIDDRGNELMVVKKTTEEMK